MAISLAPQPFDPQHALVSSPIFRSPLTLAFLRLLIAFYTLVTLLVEVIWESVRVKDGDQYFSFFTHLSYIGLCAYFFASGTQTLAYAFRARKRGANSSYPLQRWPRLLQAFHVLLLSTVVTFPILVTLVFWILLSSSSTFSTVYSSWSNISVHALNTAFALFEIFLTNVPPIPWLGLPFGILCLGGYLGVAYITKATQGFYVYDFLDPHLHHAKVAGYVIGIAAVECVAYSIVRTIMVFRERFWARRKGSVLMGSGGTEALDDWEEVNRPNTPHL